MFYTYIIVLCFLILFQHFKGYTTIHTVLRKNAGQTSDNEFYWNNANLPKLIITFCKRLQVSSAAFLTDSLISSATRIRVFHSSGNNETRRWERVSASEEWVAPLCKRLFSAKQLASLLRHTLLVKLRSKSSSIGPICS